MTEITTCDSTRYVPSTQSRIMLDLFASRDEMCVYCSCGRIVALDRREMELKQSLGKELQCMTCRNKRISMEIDFMNDLYAGRINEEC